MKRSLSLAAIALAAALFVIIPASKVDAGWHHGWRHYGGWGYSGWGWGHHGWGGYYGGYGLGYRGLSLGIGYPFYGGGFGYSGGYGYGYRGWGYPSYGFGGWGYPYYGYRPYGFGAYYGTYGLTSSYAYSPYGSSIYSNPYYGYGYPGYAGLSYGTYSYLPSVSNVSYSTPTVVGYSPTLGTPTPTIANSYAVPYSYSYGGINGYPMASYGTLGYNFVNTCGCR
jgi:hypothetical protein